MFGYSFAQPIQAQDLEDLVSFILEGEHSKPAPMRAVTEACSKLCTALLEDDAVRQIAKSAQPSPLTASLQAPADCLAGLVLQQPSHPVRKKPCQCRPMVQGGRGCKLAGGWVRDCEGQPGGHREAGRVSPPALREQGCCACTSASMYIPLFPTPALGQILAPSARKLWRSVFPSDM
eukprot:1142945-Pelagomonas_calceolata.AAC.3